MDNLEKQARDVLDRLMATWNADDLDSMFELFAPQIHWVNIVGMHWKGKPDVEHAHRVHFDIMFTGVSQTLEDIESMVRVAPQTLIVVARTGMEAFRTPDGSTRPAGTNRTTFVMSDDGDGLKIVHCANVPIIPEAQPNNPVRS